MMSSILDIRARLVVAVVFLAPAASRAVNVPLPVEGSTVNLTVFVQTQALLNENGSPDGQSPSYDVFIRRSRLQANRRHRQFLQLLLPGRQHELRTSPPCTRRGAAR